MLYHWRGISDSSSVILVRSVTTASLVFPNHTLPAEPGGSRGAEPPACYPTRVLTAAVSWAIAFFASAKNMLVLGSKYSSFSMPA